MSTSLRNVVQRRNHKERGQLAHREKFGLLEKKKDYLQRARDYHSKQKRLKALREKALFRNPDEFYFKMINSQTKKMEKLQESLHFLDEGEQDHTPTKRNKHVVFVDSESQAKKFDVVKHLDTAPELVNRKFNRPRLDTLKQASLDDVLSKEEIKEMKRSREMKYKELESRKQREKGLKRAERELQIQKALIGKGDKKKVGVDKMGLAVYKWTADRKR
ncbi:unnamed protein product [Absidia cylindrospora]